jgi:hypothetical protein
MSYRDRTVAVERRVRRLAVRRGWHLLKAQKPDQRVREHGGYMLRDADSFEIVFGDADYPYCADLDEIEAFLIGLKENEQE